MRHPCTHDACPPKSRCSDELVRQAGRSFDERSLLRAAEHKAPGRPLSARSAWVIVAPAEGDGRTLARLASAERARAKARLDDLLALVSKPPKAEADVPGIASALRCLFREELRAMGLLREAAEEYRAAPALC
jgi:hypothetical protein